jgi:hypothetical protein
MTASAQQLEQAGRLTRERPRRIAPVRRAAGEEHQQPERHKQAPVRADTHPFGGSGLEITEGQLRADLAVAVNRQVLGKIASSQARSLRPESSKSTSRTVWPSCR